MNEASSKYSPMNIGIHWLTLLLIIGLYVCVELHEYFPKGSDTRNTLIHWHFMLGLSVLWLTVIRIVAKLAYATPPVIPAPGARQQQLSAMMHGALYLLLLVMPILGVMGLSAAGVHLSYFGLEIPMLLAKNKETAHNIGEIHETLGNIGYGLIGMHALAAVFHHYRIKDNTLLRILPGKR